MKPLWIELVNTGVANRFEFDDHELIEVNWRLTNYPELYKKILEHELKHDEGRYSTNDFLHDMSSKTPGLFHFMSRHISSWTQVFPIYWDRKRNAIVYDWSNIASCVLLGATVIVIIFLLNIISYIWSNGIW